MDLQEWGETSGIDSKFPIETFDDGKNQYACDFFMENGKLNRESGNLNTISNPGTFYKLTFRDKNCHTFLEKSLEHEIIETFNNAIINGLNITINGKK